MHKHKYVLTIETKLTEKQIASHLVNEFVKWLKFDAIESYELKLKRSE